MNEKTIQRSVDVYVNHIPENDDIKPGSIAVVWMPNEQSSCDYPRVGNGFFIVYLRLRFMFHAYWCKVYAFPCTEEEVFKNEIPERVLRSLGISAKEYDNVEVNNE